MYTYNEARVVCSWLADLTVKHAKKPEAAGHELARLLGQCMQLGL